MSVCGRLCRLTLGAYLCNMAKLFTFGRWLQYGHLYHGVSETREAVGCQGRTRAVIIRGTTNLSSNGEESGCQKHSVLQLKRAGKEKKNQTAFLDFNK